MKNKTDIIKLRKRGSRNMDANSGGVIIKGGQWIRITTKPSIEARPKPGPTKH
jgi:hypothetical protein